MTLYLSQKVGADPAYTLQPRYIMAIGAGIRREIVVPKEISHQGISD